MRKPVFLFALLFAVSAQAATCWMNSATQRILWAGRPETAVVGGTTYFSPSDELLAQAGWSEHEYADGTEFRDLTYGWEPSPWIRAMDAGELAARDAAEAAAASNAAAQASLPQTFPTGIAVTNSAGNWVEFIPDGTGVVASTLAVQISQSPLDPATRKAMRDAAIADHKAKIDAAKAGINGQLQKRIENLERLLGVRP